MDKRKLNYTRYQMEERQEKPLMLEEFNSNNTVQLTVAQVKGIFVKIIICTGRVEKLEF